MGAWKWLGRRWNVLLRKQSVEDELDDEIQFHLEQEIRQYIASGHSPKEARRRALVAFGGVERYKEEVRNVRGARMLDDAVQDIRVALRSWPKQIAFVAAILVTLGIGIGGNVAMFGVLDASLFRQLPFRDAERLVLGRVTFNGEVGSSISGMDFFDYRDGASSFDELAAFTPFPVEGIVTGGEQAERVAAPIVSVDYFETLGVAPFLGRTFNESEGELGGPDVVVLSHDFWQRRFGGDPSVLGSGLTLDGVPHTVIGVMPAGFYFYRGADLWRPLQRGGSWADARQFHNFVVVGRMARGRGLAGAQAEMDAVSRRLAEAYPETNKDKGIKFTPLQEALNETYRPALTMLMAAVGLLLLVACANVAGLLLARGSARRSEFAVRAAMGAGRGRMARQLVTESALLAGGGGLIGLFLAVWLQRGILAFMELDRLGAVESALSGKAVGYAALLSLGTVVLFGVVPSMRLTGAEPSHYLRSGTRTTGSRTAARFRSTLVIGQVALTVVLLVLSGLLLRSFGELQRVETGFDETGLLTADVSIPSGKYRDTDRRVQFFAELSDRAEAVPGATAVGLVSALPVRDPGNNVRVARPEEFGVSGVFGRAAYQRAALPGYFDAMGIPLISGRDVALTDDASSPGVIVLGASLAEALFPGENAVGRVVGYDVGESEPRQVEVIGVVGDVVPTDLASGKDFVMYFPYGQRPFSSMRIAVRTSGPPAQLTSAIRDVVRSLDPDVPLAEVRTMTEVIRSSLSDRRAIMAVLGLFAVVAVLLAAVGLYGVLAYQVSRRVHEIGVRMALGASTGAVAGNVLRGGLLLVGAGVLLGIPSSLFAGRLVQSMLYGVQATDPLTLGSVAAFLGAVAALACYIPARRAAKVNPVDAFRAQ